MKKHILFVAMCCMATVNLYSTVIWHEKENKELSVTIVTERLFIRSVTKADFPGLLRLYSDPEVMRFFGYGVPVSARKTYNHFVKTWTSRWQQGDPRGGFVIFEREHPSECIGTIVAGGHKEKGAVEVASVFLPTHWRKGYATEVAKGFMSEYLPVVVQQNLTIEGSPITTVYASSSPGNIGSWKILDKLGFKPVDATTIEAATSLIEKNDMPRTLTQRKGKNKWYFVLEVGEINVNPDFDDVVFVRS